MHALMTATPGGVSTPKSKMLPIRQALNAIRGLRAEPKAALVEVCELYEHGQRRQCDATNAYLAERLGITAKSVSRLLSGLVAGGWLTLVVMPAQGNRRLLVPTEQTRGHYLPDAEGVSPLSAVSGDTPVLSGVSPKVGRGIPQSGERVSPKVGRLGYDQFTTTYDQQASMPGELAAANEKIRRLEQTITDLTTRPADAPPKPAPLDPLHFMPFAGSKYAQATAFAALLQDLGYGAAYAPYYLAQISAKAAGEDVRTPDGWQRYINRWLHNEVKNSRLLTEAPGHQPATSRAAGRPAGGQVDRRRSAIEQAMALDDETE